MFALGLTAVVVHAAAGFAEALSIALRPLIMLKALASVRTVITALISKRLATLAERPVGAPRSALLVAWTFTAPILAKWLASLAEWPVGARRSTLLVPAALTTTMLTKRFACLAKRPFKSLRARLTWLLLRIALLKVIALFTERIALAAVRPLHATCSWI